MAIKAVKAAGKAIYKVDEFTGIAEDIATVAGGEATLGARVISGLSLATEISPVGANDFKDFVRWARKGSSMMGSVNSSVAKARRAVELRMSATDAASAAHNVANASKLKKQMASDQQFGELQRTTQIMAGQGGRIPIRDAPRLANTYGGSTDDWSKIRSSATGTR